jgi:hypothetical protein
MLSVSTGRKKHEKIIGGRFVVSWQPYRLKIPFMKVLSGQRAITAQLSDVQTPNLVLQINFPKFLWPQGLKYFRCAVLPI